MEDHQFYNFFEIFDLYRIKLPDEYYNEIFYN